MNLSKLYFIPAAFFILPILLLQNMGCVKEYSYEGGDTLTMIRQPILDSIIPPPDADTIKVFPDCSLCNAEDDLSVGTWSFETGSSYVCGTTTSSGFFGGYSKLDITFFGPSACSQDTGLVMSVFLPVPLDRSRSNLIADRAAFYYYDHNAPNDIFDSQSEKPFIVTVQEFNISTGIATGTFEGTVFKPNGDTAVIKEGRYKVQIK
ncbi:MAG: hypothetical protein ABI416_14760 [Ginsengibacter sp.]